VFTAGRLIHRMMPPDLRKTGERSSEFEVETDNDQVSKIMSFNMRY